MIFIRWIGSLLIVVVHCPFAFGQWEQHVVAPVVWSSDWGGHNIEAGWTYSQTIGHEYYTYGTIPEYHYWKKRETGFVETANSLPCLALVNQPYAAPCTNYRSQYYIRHFSAISPNRMFIRMDSVTGCGSGLAEEFLYVSDSPFTSLTKVYSFPPAVNASAHGINGFSYFWDSLNGFYFTAVPDQVRNCYLTLYTDDGGLSWQTVSAPNSISLDRIKLVGQSQDIFIHPTAEGAVVLIEARVDGGIRERGVILRTSALGKKWEVVLPTPNYAFRQLAVFDDSTWLVSTRESIGNWRLLTTNDAGKTWEEFAYPPELEWLGMNVLEWAKPANPTDKGFLLADSKGRTYISYDRGKNWLFLDDADHDFVSFSDTRHGVSIIQEYKDQGQLTYPYAHLRFFDYGHIRRMVYPDMDDTSYLCKGEELVCDFPLEDPYYWSSFSDGRDTLASNKALRYTPASSGAVYLFTEFHSDTLPVIVREHFPQGLVKETYSICTDSSLSLSLPKHTNGYYEWSNATKGEDFQTSQPGDYFLHVPEGEYCDTTISFHIKAFPFYKTLLDSGICFEDWPGISHTFFANIEPLPFLAPFEESDLTVFSAPATQKLFLTDSNGCPAELNYSLYNTCPHEVYVPSVFNPDGKMPENKIFKPYVRHVDAFQIRVYNRWGQLVYSGTALDKGWDGAFRGAAAPAGLYTYRLSYTYTEEKVVKRKQTQGYVMLLR